MLQANGEYQKPTWSSCPQTDEFGLEVIKQGVIVENIPLKSREYFLVGRQLDRVHIPAEHPSVSRVHAVLNFHQDGSLMICDLGSAQGTFLNKKMLDKNVFLKVNVGDIIKFAQSTRLYIVKGPEEDMPMEYNSENLEKLRKEAEEREMAAKRERERYEMNSGVTWGISMDDDYDEDSKDYHEHDDDDNHNSRNKRQAHDEKRSFLPEYLRKDENYDRKYGDRYEAPIREDEAKSKKDQEILEKIRKKERKIQNMQEENRRIYMKEQSQDDGLTEGQLAAVARNDKAIEQLSEEIDQLVNQIRSKYNENGESGETQGSSTAQKRRRGDEENDDSDVLDTTTQTADVSTNWRLRKKLNRMDGLSNGIMPCNEPRNHHQALSYEEIKAVLDTASTKLISLQKEIQSHVGNAQQLQLKLLKDAVQQADEVDDIDKFIVQDQIKESQQRLKSLHAEEVQLQDTVKQYSKLLAVATPALPSLVSHLHTPHSTNIQTPLPSSLSNESQPCSPTSSSSAAVPRKTQISLAANDEEDANADEFQQNRKIALEDFKKFVEEEKHRAAEEEKLRASKGNDQNKCRSSFSSSNKLAELDAFEKKLRDAAEGVEVSPTAQNQSIDKRKVVAGPSRQDNQSEGSKRVSKPLKKSSYEDDAVLESGEYKWVPPKRQTGDGRTSLNDKFGY